MLSPLQIFSAKKRDNIPLAMLALYDAPSAQVAAQAGIDAILVGDSMGNTALGFDSTIPVTVADIARGVGAVARGVQKSARRDVPIIADLPLEAMKSAEFALQTAISFLQLGAHAVKIEGFHPQLVRDMGRIGVPVMGHLGFTPQAQMRFGGVVQGKTVAQGQELRDAALELEKNGAFSCVLEAVTREVAASITASLDHAATIGIGSGNGCNGQVLVFDDLIGLSPRLFKFAKSYCDTATLWQDAIASFAREVRKGDFPCEAHSWPLSQSEREIWEKNSL